MASATIALLTWITDAAHSDFVALLPGHRGVIHASNTLGFAGIVYPANATPLLRNTAF
jgi:hypothetical protein